VPELREVGAEAEIVSLFINSQLEMEFLEEHPQLRYIATRSGATDHLNLGACRARGVLVSNVRDYGDHTVAEHTFALLLALSRRLREIMALSKEKTAFSYEATRAFDLYGKTLGIIGMGYIGQRVAELAKAFHMRVVAFDPVSMPPERAERLGFQWLPFEELLAQAQVISLHVRLSPWTHHLFNRETFARCRPGVIIINTSRGRLIETDALREALDSGQVGGAGLDVLEQEGVLRQPASQIISAQIVEHLRSATGSHEAEHDSRLRHLQELVKSDALLARHNVVFTPHVAFNSEEAFERLVTGTIENIRAFVRGEPIHLVAER
jgi:D-lactate dehydrogenase